jgi:NAD-dependent SIR2 family protein deacetylase
MALNTSVTCGTCNAGLEVLHSNSGVVKCDYCGTDNVLNKEVRLTLYEDSARFQLALRKAMIASFDNAALQILGSTFLAVHPQFDFENVKRESKNLTVMEFIGYAKRRGMLKELYTCVLDEVPEIDITVYL